MIFSRIALASAVAAVWSAITVVAGPTANAERSSWPLIPRELEAPIRCTGGMTPDSRCTNGLRKNGCRCDSKRTYLCDPPQMAKNGGICAKCGC